MSWDIFVQDFPSDAKSIEDIPDDFKPGSIGKTSDIIERIKEVVPTADFSNPAWGTIDGDGWSIEVNIDEEEDCHGFAFHVRGGDAVVGVIGAILQHLKLRAVDSESGDFLVAGPEAIASFRRWRTYRNQVVGDNSRPNPPVEPRQSTLRKLLRKLIRRG